MNDGRNISPWAGLGGFLGFLILQTWAVGFYLVVAATSDEPLDLESILLCLVFAVLFTACGPSIFAAALGAVCGFGCALLPVGLKRWQRVLAIVVSFHAAVGVTFLLLDIFNPRIPSWLCPIFPGFP